MGRAAAPVLLEATGESGAAGIGGGFYEAGGTVTINGGVVTATGCNESGASAAGIGGGAYCPGGNVTINGGIVTATGGENAAGIGGGCYGGNHGTVAFAEGKNFTVKTGSTAADTAVTTSAYVTDHTARYVYIEDATKTVADILATAEDGFPTIKETAWVNAAKNSKIFVKDGQLYVENNASTPQSENVCAVSGIVEKDADNNYVLNGILKIKFVMDNNKLSSIVIACDTIYPKPFVLDTFIVPFFSPVFSVTEETFVDSLNVELTCATKGATIFYCEGSAVNKGNAIQYNTIQYTEPITITKTTTIYAVAMKENGEMSEQVSKTYTKVTPHVHGTGSDALTFDKRRTDATKLPTTAGNYYLDKDVTLDAIWTVPAGTTNLCLNGHIIKLDTGKTGSVITVPKDATLNLYDCAETSGKITGGNAQFGGGVNNKGTFNMYGGEISGNSAGENGAGGGVYNSGTFNLNGGTIAGNKAKQGGGVANPGSFTMKNGTISANIAETGGGGVEIENDGCTFTMNGDSIIGNIVEELNGGLHKGAGVHFNKGTFNVSGEVHITNNECANVASNVYLRKNTVTFNVAELDTKSSIGIFAAGLEDGTATTVKTADGSHGLTCFTSDNTAYVVKLNNGTDEAGDEYLELVAVYAITNNAPESGKDTANGYLTVDKTTAAQGDIVTVTVTPNEGYQLKSLTVTKSGGAEEVIAPKGVFTMPAYDVTVTAEFEKEPPSPDTGDESNTVLWMMSAVLFSIGLCACLVINKKIKYKEKSL